MAAVGRGRGRGRGFTGVKDVRPGKVDGDSIDQLTQDFQTLDVSSSTDNISSFVTSAKTAAVSEEKLTEIFTLIYNKCLLNWKFSITAAKICQELSAVQVDGVKFRDILLKSIQKDFKDKDTLRQESPQKCLGCLCLLCQSFVYLRNTDGLPFMPLVSPVLDCIDLLLDNKANDTEMEGACVQLAAVGPVVAKYDDAKKLSKFRSVLRTKVLDSCGSRNTRLLMIDLLEVIASDWTKCNEP